MDKTLEEHGVTIVRGELEKGGVWRVHLMKRSEANEMCACHGQGGTLTEAMETALAPPPEPEEVQEDEPAELPDGAGRPADGPMKPAKTITPKAVEVETVGPEDTERLDAATLANLRKEAADEEAKAPKGKRSKKSKGKGK